MGVNLDWLEKIQTAINQGLKYKKNYFDIIGFPRWETVNSNLLAFYLEKNEEHNFETLFIYSLLKLIKKNNPELNIDGLIEEEYRVYREYFTKGRKRIDIVVKSHYDNLTKENSDSEVENTNWAVILENKINSGVSNDLIDYFNSVDATIKLPVLLSKHKTSEFYNTDLDEIKYHHITHRELIEEVQKNLYKHFSSANEKHLILLKEFISNINSFYFQEKMEKNNEQLIKQFYKEGENINSLIESYSNMLGYVCGTVFGIFSEFSFEPNSYTSSNNKHFYSSDFPSFRFYVYIGSLRTENVLYAYYELAGEDTQYGSKLKDMLAANNIFTPNVYAGNGGGDTVSYNHIYEIVIPFNAENNFPDELKLKLESEFFKHPNKFLENAQKMLDELKSDIS